MPGFGAAVEASMGELISCDECGCAQFRGQVVGTQVLQLQDTGNDGELRVVHGQGVNVTGVTEVVCLNCDNEVQRPIENEVED